MSLISRVLTVVLVLYSYFEIKTGLPWLAARVPTHSNAGAELVVVGTTLRILLLVQILGSGVFLSVPYVGEWFPECVHFGWRRLSDYTSKQRERVMPLLRDMVGLMSFVLSLDFALRIHLLIGEALSTRTRRPAWWLTAGLVVGEGAIILYYLRLFEAEAGEE